MAVKWQGDFTFSRLRAQLAEANNFPQDVEPDYEVTLRSKEDGGVVVSRRKLENAEEAWASAIEGEVACAESQQAACSARRSQVFGSTRAGSATELRALQRAALGASRDAAARVAEQAGFSPSSTGATGLLAERVAAIEALRIMRKRDTKFLVGSSPSRRASEHIDRSLVPRLHRQAAELAAGLVSGVAAGSAVTAVRSASAGATRPSSASGSTKSSWARRTFDRPGSAKGARRSTPALGASSSEAQLFGTSASSSQPPSPLSVAKSDDPLAPGGSNEAASRQLWRSASGAEIHIKNSLRGKGTAIDTSAVKLEELAKVVVPSVQAALRDGADIDWRCDDWDGATLLLKAARSCQFEMALYFLALGADPLVTDNSGRGVLHWAAASGCTALVEHLIDRVPELPLASADLAGDAALHIAASCGQLVVVRQLCRAGVPAQLQNANAFTALGVAERLRKWDVVDYLRNMKQQRDDLRDQRKPVRELQRTCDMEQANTLQKSRAKEKKKTKKPTDAKKDSKRGHSHKRK